MEMQRKRKGKCCQTKIPFKKQRVREPRPPLELPEDSWAMVLLLEAILTSISLEATKYVKTCNISCTVCTQSVNLCLPMDTQIIPFLKSYNVSALSLVCRSSRAACLSPSNYERFAAWCGWEKLVKLLMSGSTKLRFSKLTVVQLNLLPEQWCELLERAESLQDVAICTELHNLVPTGASGANPLQSLGSKQFDSLRVLSFQGCHGERALWEALAISCPNLQELRITEDGQQADTKRIGDDVLAAVSRFPSLVDLCLSGCQAITGQGLRCFRQSKLTHLSLEAPFPRLGYSAFEIEIVRAAATLEKLELIYDVCSNADSFLDMNTLLRELAGAAPNLRSLQLRSRTDEADQRMAFWEAPIQCLIDSTFRLTELAICGCLRIWDPFSPLNGSDQSLVRALQRHQTIEKLDLDFMTGLAHARLSDFVAIVCLLPNLKHLILRDADENILLAIANCTKLEHVQISHFFLRDDEHIIRVLHTLYALASACPKLLRVEIYYAIECHYATSLSSLILELNNWCPVRARATIGSRTVSQAWLESRLQVASLQERMLRESHRSRRSCWICSNSFAPFRRPPDVTKIRSIKRRDQNALLSYKYKHGSRACKCGQTYFALEFAMHRLPYFFD
eukprot:g63736.t1